MIWDTLHIETYAILLYRQVYYIYNGPHFLRLLWDRLAGKEPKDPGDKKRNYQYWSRPEDHFILVPSALGAYKDIYFYDNKSDSAAAQLFIV